MHPSTALFALTSVLVSATAWAIPLTGACRSGSSPRVWTASQGPMCLLLHDPWQDCAEDPWQLSSRRSDTFSDPWQDSADPWQPFPAPRARSARVSEDPWQPLAARSSRRSTPSKTAERFEDPWQPPRFADPWQDGAEKGDREAAQKGDQDPWQAR